jgi:hypothetical protein
MLKDMDFRSKQGQQTTYTKAEIAKELPRLEKELQGRPDVVEAMKKRKQIYTALRIDLIAAAKDVGLDYSKLFTNPEYMRHAVIDYLDTSGTFGAGGKLGVPKHGWQKKAEGSTRLVNRNVGATDTEVFAQILHDIAHLKAMKVVQDNYNIEGQVFKSPMEPDYLAMQGYLQTAQIPEGYVEYRMKGLYKGEVNENALQDVIQSAIKDEFGLNIAARKSNGKAMIVRKEVAEALDQLRAKPTDNAFIRTWDEVNNVWKVVQLFAPHRFAKYSARNVSGDVEAFTRGIEKSAFAFIKNSPAIAKEIAHSASELYGYYRQGTPPDAVTRQWLDFGGASGIMPYQEISQSWNTLPAVKRITQAEKMTISDWVKLPFEKYKEIVLDFNGIREGALRRAAYAMFQRQINANIAAGKGARPNSWGASNPTETQAVIDKLGVNQGAFKLSEELMINYGDVSPFTKQAKRGVLPFLSFTEGNLKREIRLFENQVLNAQPDTKLAIRNQVMDKKLLSEVLTKGFGQLATKSPYLVLRGIGWWLKATGLLAVTTAWNRNVVDEADDLLSLQQKKRAHITFGKGKSGNVYSFQGIGASTDIASMFGFDMIFELWTKLEQGRITPARGAVEIAKGFPNYVAKMVGPAFKFPVEMLTGKTLYPDAFNPRQIRDKGEYAARQVGLGGAYREMAG